MSRYVALLTEISLLVNLIIIVLLLFMFAELKDNATKEENTTKEDNATIQDNAIDKYSTHIFIYMDGNHMEYQEVYVFGREPLYLVGYKLVSEVTSKKSKRFVYSIKLDEEK